MNDECKQSASLAELEIRLFRKTLDGLKEDLAYDPRLEEVWAFVVTHYSETNVSLDAASRASGMSKSSLNGKLRLLIGLTFHELLTNYRIYCSIQAALARDRTFTEIALMTGFEASSSYTRAVKRTLNGSPKLLLPRGPDRRRQLLLPPLEGTTKQSLGLESPHGQFTPYQNSAA